MDSLIAVKKEHEKEEVEEPLLTEAQDLILELLEEGPHKDDFDKDREELREDIDDWMRRVRA